MGEAYNLVSIPRMGANSVTVSTFSRGLLALWFDVSGTVVKD